MQSDGEPRETISVENEFGLALPIDSAIETENALWSGDLGTLSLEARKSLLKLLRGPFVSADDDKQAWNAIMSCRFDIESRLADMFLVLVVDEDEGIAFVKNAGTPEDDLPKAVRSQSLNLMDTIVLLMLRKLLLIEQAPRLIIGRGELYTQVSSFRPTSGMDEAAFLKAFNSAWSRLVNLRILRETDIEGRAEVSPVLRLVLGAEEIAAISAQYDIMLAEAGEVEPAFAIPEPSEEPTDEAEQMRLGLEGESGAL